jgi:hypothetical protein
LDTGASAGMTHGEYLVVARDPENECRQCGHHRGMHYRGGCASSRIDNVNTSREAICYCKCFGFVTDKGAKPSRKGPGRDRNWGWRG